MYLWPTDGIQGDEAGEGINQADVIQALESSLEQLRVGVLP